MAAIRLFHVFRSRNAVRSAYDENMPRAARTPLTARWSFRSEVRPACRWAA